MKKHNLLYIDDEKHNLVSFSHTFSDEYGVFTATNTADAYEILKQNSIQLIVSDQRMPGETGVKFLTRIRKEFPSAIRTILTGYSDFDAVVEAINHSHIYYYFQKPWDEQKLKLVFRNALESLTLSQENALLLSELNDALAELRTKAYQLEEQVEHRQELIERLERANQVKSEFLSTISHELRTPLNPIIGYSDLMLLREKDEEERGFLSTINRCGNDLLKLIEGILDFVSVAQDTADDPSEPFSAKALLHDMRMVANSLLAPEKEVEVRTRLLLSGKAGEDDIQLFGRQSSIRQVLHNLVSNACKFTERGEIVIELNLLGEPQQRILKCSVRDTGIGIDRKDFETIFDAFKQVDQSLSRRFEGLGLGLALCRRLATRLRGSLSVESALGRGSVFTLEIPMRTQAGLALERTGNKFPSYNIKSLVVDDNESNAQVTASMLRLIDCQPTVVTCGVDALEALRKERFDMVFVDLLMPEMSGTELAREIVAMELEPMPRLVAVTADLSKKAAEEAYAAGVEKVMYKPIQIESFLSFMADLGVSK